MYARRLDSDSQAWGVGLNAGKINGREVGYPVNDRCWHGCSGLWPRKSRKEPSEIKMKDRYTLYGINGAGLARRVILDDTECTRLEMAGNGIAYACISGELHCAMISRISKLEIPLATRIKQIVVEERAMRSASQNI